MIDNNIRDNSKNKTTHLISSYNPEREADRFIYRILQERNITEHSIFIVIGPVKQYISNSLISNGIEPTQIINCFFLKEHFVNNVKPTIDWIFNSSTPLSIQLQATIALKNIRDIEIIEWQPCIKAYPQIANSIYQEILILKDRITSNIHTFGIMGRKWLSNFIQNIISPKRFNVISSIEGNVLLAVPGPSLNDILSIIKKHRKNICVAALSSAVIPLIEASIIPDIIFQTDGGYWANRLLDYTDNEHPHLIKTASSSTVLFNNTEILLNECPFEIFIHPELKDSFKVFPDQGTVAVTAMNYLQNITKGSLYIAGLDLEFPIDTMHTQNHYQDSLWFRQQTRLSTHFSKSVNYILTNSSKNSFGLYSSRGLTQYADYISSLSLTGNNSVIRINPSNIPLKIKTISLTSFTNLSTNFSSFSIKDSYLKNTIKHKQFFIEQLEHIEKTIEDSLLEEFLLWTKTEMYLQDKSCSRSDIIETLLPYKELANEFI